MRITVPLITWTVIITVILTALGGISVFFIPFPFMCNMNLTNMIATPGVDLLGMPFIVILAIALLMRIPFMKKYLLAGSLTTLYVAALAATFMTPDFWYSTNQFMTGRVGTEEAVMKYVPEFLSPPKEVGVSLINGGFATISWGQLFPAMIWHFFSWALFIGISVGLVSIFRRQWIDVEILPYPQVAIAHSALIGVGEVTNPKWVGRTAFILGFIVGLGLELIRAGILFFPWFPDVYSWRTNTCGPGSQWITFPGTVWHYGIAKHTPVYALLFLAPLHSLFSVVFWGIIYEVASAIACALGYYTGYTDMGFCGKSWCSQNTPFAEPPLAFGCLIAGVMLGAFVMTIFHERHHIMMTLKMTFRSIKDPKLEAEEPMSYRSAWLIFITSYVLMIVLFMSAGMTLWASFVVILTGIVTWFTTSQLWGRIGYSNEPGYNFAPAFAKMLVWPTEYALPVTHTDHVLVHNFVYHLGSHRPSAQWCVTLYTILGSCKMGKMMKVHPRNVIKVASIALVTAMITACIMYGMLAGAYGLKVTSAFSGSHTNLMERVNHMWAVPSPRPMVDIAPWIAGGFTFMVVLSLLHVRFLWMPDPLMSIVAWDWVGGLHGTWAVALVDCVIKWLLLRIGGSKLYEEKAIPFVGGFILGAALNALIASIGAFTKYLY